VKNKQKCISALHSSLRHMSHSLKRMGYYESTRSRSDEVYAIFHQILALYYETEAIEFGLESKEMNRFMCQFYGKDET
jgi:hypothetical protein